VVVRQAFGVIAGCLGVLLTLPSLMFLFIQLRGFDASDFPAAQVFLPIQLGVAALLILVSIILLRGGRKKL
jgi:hypothetical protein